MVGSVALHAVAKDDGVSPRRWQPSGNRFSERRRHGQGMHGDDGVGPVDTRQMTSPEPGTARLKLSLEGRTGSTRKGELRIARNAYGGRGKQVREI